MNIRPVPGAPEKYEVESESKPGEWYTVEVQTFRSGQQAAECECEGYYYRRACKHATRALQEFRGETMTETTEQETPSYGIIHIDRAMAAIYGEVKYVQKREPARGAGINYSYAGETDIIDALRPAMVKHGVVARVLSVRDVAHDAVEVGSKGSRMQRCTLIATVRFTHAPSGTYVDCEAVGEGMDSGDKASNKAMTGALKYALRQTFVLETGNDPDDSRPELEAPPPVQRGAQNARPAAWDIGELRELLGEAGLKMSALAGPLGVDLVTADNYRGLIDAWMAGAPGRTLPGLVKAAIEFVNMEEE